MRGLLLTLVLLLVAPATAGAEALAASYFIEAEVSQGLEEIRGDLRVELRNDTAAPLSRLILWLYPNLFAGDVAGVSDVNRQFYEPFGESRGGIELGTLRVGGRITQPIPVSLDLAPEGTARAIDLPVPLAPGESISIALDFITTVPHRLGPFSRAKGVLTALGGWHPFITLPAARPVERQPAPADWRLRIRVPADHLALVGGERAGENVLRNRAWVDLVVRRSEVQPIRGRGGAVWPLSNPPIDEWANDSLPDPAPFASTYVADEISKLLAQMDAWGDAQPGLPDPGNLDLVIVPMRSEIALPTAGIVAISDRAYEITSFPMLQRFHARGIARAYFARRFLPLVRGCESPARAPQIADALGERYAARFTEEVLGDVGDAFRLLGTFDFLPNIDDFLRSPKAAFAHVYFDPVATPIRVRDEPWTFDNAAPRGKLLFVKLEDWLGREAFDELIQAYVQGGRCPLIKGADALAGEDLEGFFRTWTERLPAEDLRVRIVSTAEIGEGIWRSEIEVRRLGDTPQEMIETLATERDGKVHLLQWRAAAGEEATTFVIEADQPITRLVVDPRGRVTQTPTAPGEVSVLGDRVPAPIQILLTRFSVSYSNADATLYGDIDFLLRPREAVHRRLGFGASYRQARLEVRTALTFGFGRRIDAARFAWNWGVGLSADYLRPNFGGEQTSKGYAVGPSLVLTYDDRPPAASPLRGTAFAARTSLSAGANQGGASQVYAGLSAAGLRLFPLGPRSAIAIRLKGSLLVGSPPVQELITLGGSDEGLRGFPLESVLSEQRVVGSTEWRHPLLPDLDIDLSLARLRQVSGVLFADGAWAGKIFPLVPEAPESGFFADAGYGLRFEYDLFGVRPLIFALDVAVPINRLPAAPNAPPVVLSVRAGQAFSGL